jgi:hypothetical protein
MKTLFVCFIAIGLSLVLQAPQDTKSAKPQASAPSQPPGTMQLGEIDFFGYGDLDPSKLREALPVRQGQRIVPAEWNEHRRKIKESIRLQSGHAPTDITVVCCNPQGAYLLYIGLSVSGRPVPQMPAPHGDARLPAQALRLEKDYEDAMSKAVREGRGGEEDATGFALSVDPAARAIQLKMRKFAVGNPEMLRNVLRSSGDVDHRRAAAVLLGYARASAAQVDALLRAGRDADSDVRNNAVRALGVLAGAGDKIAVKIPAAPFLELLNSDQWTDRNKGGMVLSALTQSRDPDTLVQLHLKAMPALIEMARWQAPGHAYTSRILLGRIAGIEELKLNEMAGHADQIETIVKAAQVTR